MSDKSLITGSFTGIGIVGLIFVCLFIYTNPKKPESITVCESCQRLHSGKELKFDNNNLYTDQTRQKLLERASKYQRVSILSKIEQVLASQPSAKELEIEQFKQQQRAMGVNESDLRLEIIYILLFTDLQDELTYEDSAYGQKTQIISRAKSRHFTIYCKRTPDLLFVSTCLDILDNMPLIISEMKINQ